MKASLRYEHLREDDRKAVIKAREHVATVDSRPECENGSVIDMIARKFRRYELWLFLPTDLSVQKTILDATPDSQTLYAEARQGARQVLFDLAFDIICGPGITTKENTLQAAMTRTRLIIKPGWIKFDEDMVDYLAENASRDGSQFWREMQNEAHNTERRENILQLDMHALVMARHWVNPHCPLWMMSLPVLQKVLPAIAEVPVDMHPQWTPDTIRNRIEILNDAGACRFPEEPIFDVKLRTRPKIQPDAVVVSASARTKLANLRKTCDEAVKAITLGNRSTEAIKNMMEKVMALERAKTVNDETPFYDRGSGRVVEQFSVCVKNTQPPKQNLGYCIEVSPKKPRTTKVGPKR